MTDTFCTVETFDAVAIAIAECAFVTSALPVIMSLEMHCSPKQQRLLATALIKHLGGALLTYDELCETGRASSLSPLDLKRRVVIKGKVKASTAGKSRLKGARLSAIMETAVMRPSRGVGRLPRYLRTVSRLTLRSQRASHGVTSNAKDNEIQDKDSRSNSSIRLRLSGLGAATGTAKQKVRTDALLAGITALRSASVNEFLGAHRSVHALPITSINEERLLQEMSLSEEERNKIMGLMGHGASQALAASSLSSTARNLAHDPPATVGELQRLAAERLLRPYPLGLRFSGANMDPCQAWLAGGQSVALNMCFVDIPLQLHYSLFDRTGGYAIKPQEMRRGLSAAGTNPPRWPPHRKTIHLATIQVLSLHNLPKRSEARPRMQGPCHDFAPELSGASSPPDNGEQSCPQITISLRPIGGFCAVSDSLPPPMHYPLTEWKSTVGDNGLNVRFGDTVHCLAAEPHATFLRVAVRHGWEEVAFETCVLGRLRPGFRVFRLRSTLGTRIELCTLFVKISFGRVDNAWASAADLRQEMSAMDQKFRQELSAMGHQKEAAVEAACAEKEAELVALREALEAARAAAAAVG